MFSEEVKKVCDYYKNKNKSGLRQHKFYSQIKSETDFLPEKTNISQRSWHVLNNTKNIPKCKVCDEEVKWNINSNTYRVFCSYKCSSFTKSKELNLKRFGEVYPTNINKKKIQEIFKKTDFLESNAVLNQRCWHLKYNIFSKILCDNDNCYNEVGWQLDFSKYRQFCSIKCSRNSISTLEKQKQTNLNKYGVEYAAQSKIISKRIGIKNKINWQNKSGEEKEEILRKQKQTNLDRYDVENFNQKHLSKESLDKLKDPEYLKKQHYNKKKTLKEIAKELGMYGTSSINKYFNKYNIPILTHFSSTGEKEVISYIKEIYKKDFPTNTRKVITPLELDIYLEDLKLAVEFNGTYWHSDKEKDEDYHFNKTIECYKKKIRLINIYEYEWDNDKEEVKYWLNKYITNNLDDIITKDVYLKDIADKKEIILSLNWTINYELLKQNNFKFKETLEPKLIKINNYNIYDAGKIILEKIT